MTKWILLVFITTLLGCNPAFADAVIFNASDVKALKPTLDLNGTSKVLGGSANPQSSATNAPKGSSYLSTSTGFAYQKTDAGSSTNWNRLLGTAANGSAGQLLTSNGSSAELWTTATFPSTASSTGTILRANGTNWVATTAAYPATAGTSGTILRSNGTDWVNTTATYPSTFPINEILYASSANVVNSITPANNGVLVTSSGGVPSISSTIPTATQDNITRLGTVASGVWSATAIGVTKGGTGLTTVAANRLLYASATDTIAGLASAANGTLVTDGSSVPSISSTLPSAVQGNITTLGTITTATTFSNTTDSTSITTGGGIFGGGIGVTKAMFVGGTTNQLGTPQTSATGYTAFSGNIAANSTGITDTQRAIGIVSNAYYSTNAPTRLANLSGGAIILQARDSSTSGVIRFESNTIADGTAASPTLRGFMDAFGKWTLGSSGGTQQHAINGDMLFTGGIGLGGGTSLLSYHDKSTFTTAVTGYAAVNVTCNFERTGSTVKLVCPAITGTSNGTTFRIPLPAALQSSLAIDQEFIQRTCTDNGVASITNCLTFVPSSGTYVDLRYSYASGTNWTASGTKSFGAFSITYLIN